MVTLLNAIDTCHENVIHDAAIDYYGVQLATCSSDNIVKVFHLKNGTFTHVADLKGHLRPVLQVSWAHPKFGNVLASCSHDRRVIVWKENREWIKWWEYKNHDASVNSVCSGPSEYGLVFACGSSDGSISIISGNRQWEAKKINAHRIGVNAVSWAPYVSLRNHFGQSPWRPMKRIVSAGCDFLVKIWVEVNGHWDEIARLTNHCDWVRDVAWSSSISIPCARIASASDDKKVIIWSSDDEISWSAHELPQFDDVVWNLSWSPTGNLLAVSDGSNKVTLWKETPLKEWICVSQVAGDNSSTSPRPLLQHVCGLDCYLKHPFQKD